MNHDDHVHLLQKGIPNLGGVWADFGSGIGAFTLALAELIGETGVIYSVDRDKSDLQKQERAMRDRFPKNVVHYITADFTKALSLPPLDGIVMANALHFVKRPQQKTVIQQMKSYLKADGRFVLVEYDVDKGNMWVPHPLSFNTWQSLAAECGFAQTQQIGLYPSRFLNAIYSAVSLSISTG